MRIFDAVLGFDWDAGNVQKNVDKHDVANSAAEQVFFNEPLLVVADDKHSMDEVRFLALGKDDAGRLLRVVFTLRDGGTKIRVISAHDMSRKERRIYEQSA